MYKGYRKFDIIKQTYLAFFIQTSLKSFQSLLPWIVSRTSYSPSHKSCVNSTKYL